MKCYPFSLIQYSVETEEKLRLNVSTISDGVKGSGWAGVVALARDCFCFFIIIIIHCLFWLAESVQWILESSVCDVIPADYAKIMSRSRVMISKSRVIMSSSHTLCCLPSVRKRKHHLYFFVQCIIKQLLDSVFVISRIRVISLGLRLRLIAPSLTLIILDITKASSSNCLVLFYLFIYFFFFVVGEKAPRLFSTIV